MMEKNSEIRTYRIGEYAKYLGVTPDFLKHYEQYGLVSPVTKESGYRYYPFYQSFKILECMRLRNYGLTLKDMDTLLNQDDLATIQQKLDHQAKELERKIQFEQAVVDEQHWFTHWLERMKDKTEDWSIVDMEELLFLPHSNQYDFMEDERIHQILNDWVSWMPIVKSCMEVRNWKSIHEQQPASDWNYSWGLIVKKSSAQQYQLPITSVVKTVPAKKVFLYNYIASGLRSEKEIFADSNHPALQKMRQLGLTPTGPIYKICLMYTNIGTDTKQYGILMIPIE